MNRGDYLLALKKNHKKLYQDVERYFNHAETCSKTQTKEDVFETCEKGHGRIEKRLCRVLPVDHDWLPSARDWPGLKTVVQVKSVRTSRKKETQATRYYLSSCPPNAERCLFITRAHWTIENTCHWSLDVTFREDDSRIRKDNAPENFSIFRSMAHQVLKNEPSFPKESIPSKRRRAAFDDEMRERLIQSILSSNPPLNVDNS